MVYVFMGFRKTNQFGSHDSLPLIPIPGDGVDAPDPVQHLSVPVVRLRGRFAPLFNL